MIIYLKNGRIVESSSIITDLKTSDGKITSIKWVGRPGDALAYVDPSEIVAITAKLSFTDWLKAKFKG